MSLSSLLLSYNNSQSNNICIQKSECSESPWVIISIFAYYYWCWMLNSFHVFYNRFLFISFVVRFLSLSQSFWISYFFFFLRLETSFHFGAFQCTFAVFKAIFHRFNHFYLISIHMWYALILFSTIQPTDPKNKTENRKKIDSNTFGFHVDCIHICFQWLAFV